MSDRDARAEAWAEIVLDEVRRAQAKYPPFNGPHEGWAVLREEVDELWDDVKGNDLVGAQGEAVQVAAMAIRFLVDVVPPCSKRGGMSP